jgi:hypothetical protein
MNKKNAVITLVALLLIAAMLSLRTEPPHIGTNAATMPPETAQDAPETPRATVTPTATPAPTTPPMTHTAASYDDETDEACLWEAHVDLYRQYIASVIFLWDDMTEDERQDHREFIIEKGVAFMDETTARRLGVWDGYPEPPYACADVIMLARTVWGEARGCTPDEWRLVVWTVLQRVDRPDKYGDTIEAVVTAPRQFVGYRTSHPVCPDIRDVVITELMAWAQGAEPPTHPRYAPTAPYFYFDGDGRNNWFRKEWRP